MSGPRVLVLLSLPPTDPDDDPPAAWLTRVPELAGAEVVWIGTDRTSPPLTGRVGAPAHMARAGDPLPSGGVGCALCGQRVTPAPLAPGGWMHSREWARRHR